MIKIAPSILSANFADLGGEIQRVVSAGADMIHIDVMDGHFVPNLTIGPPVVKALRQITTVPFDVHLMIDNPQEMVASFVDAGADIITVHAEATVHLHRVLQSIKEQGVKVGVSLNPATPVCSIEEVLAMVDRVLIMTVNPGYGGQAFIPAMLDKVARLHKMIQSAKLAVEIEVDGGINPVTASQVVAAGATILVAGSAVYGAPDMAAMIKQLRTA